MLVFAGALLGLNNSNFASADEVNAALGRVPLIHMLRRVISLQVNVALISNFGADYCHFLVAQFLHGRLLSDRMSRDFWNSES